MQNLPVYACIDGSSLTDAVCDFAAWAAAHLQTSLILLHTINHHQENADHADFSGNIGLGSQEHLLEEIIVQEQQKSKQKLVSGKQLLQQAKEKITAAGFKTPDCQLRHGELRETLKELESEIGLLVLGLRGCVHDQQVDKIGAKLAGIVRSLHLPIFIINHDFCAPKHLMIAYDGSRSADHVVAWVASQPLFHGTTCHLVHVDKNIVNAASMLEQTTEKLHYGNEIKVVCAHLYGKVDEELCRYQQQHPIDLVVMGAFSHHRLHDMFMGSVTQKMLVKSTKPLLLLR